MDGCGPATESHRSSFCRRCLKERKEGLSRPHAGNALFTQPWRWTLSKTRAPSKGLKWAAGRGLSDAFDFDNDGTPEIYVTCGMLTNSGQKDLMSFFWRQVVSRTPALLEPAPAYENGWNALNQLIREDYSWNGHESNVFYRAAKRAVSMISLESPGLDVAEDSRAFAVTDLDGDGNLDLVLKSRLGPQVRAFRNNCGRERDALWRFAWSAQSPIATQLGESGSGDCRLRSADC